MKRVTKKTIFSIILLSFLTLAFILNIIFYMSASFADSFNSSVSVFFRFILAKLTFFLPFSLAEILLFLTPAAAVFLSIYVNKKGGSILHRIKVCFLYILSLLAIIYILFVLTFAAGYKTPLLGEKIGLADKPVSAIELYDTIEIVIAELNNAAADIEYNKDGSSDMPFNLKEISQEFSRTYKQLYADYGLTGAFSSRIKPLIISPVMTYTHISGVYAFFTGEANLNTNYPDYVCVYTTAHEMAHQRGISRENEANFMAYLICISSENPYARYSGYLSMYNYLASALYTADSDLYNSALSKVSDKARGEMRAYSLFFDKYRQSKAAEVTDTINDSFLKSQGTEGSVSYGMVVDLAVSYYKSIK